MQSRALVNLAWNLATLLPLAKNTCTLSNKLDAIPDLAEGGTLDADSRIQLCDHQADGNYQLAMMTSRVSVPTLEGGNALEGVAGAQSFILFDAECVPLGAYEPGEEGNVCGTPVSD